MSAAQESVLAPPTLSGVLENTLLTLGISSGVLIALMLGCWLKLRHEAASATRYAQLHEDSQEAEAQTKAAQRRQNYYRAGLVIGLVLLVFCVLYAFMLAHYERRFLARYTAERARQLGAALAHQHPRGKRSESECDPTWSINLGFYCTLYQDVVMDPFYLRKINRNSIANPIYLGHVTESYLLGLLEHIPDPRFVKNLHKLFCDSERKSVFLNAMKTFEAVNRAG